MAAKCVPPAATPAVNVKATCPAPAGDLVQWDVFAGTDTGCTGTASETGLVLKDDTCLASPLDKTKGLMCSTKAAPTTCTDNAFKFDKCTIYTEKTCTTKSTDGGEQTDAIQT